MICVTLALLAAYGLCVWLTLGLCRAAHRGDEEDMD